LIALIGAALRNNLRSGELPARLGGDEFVIVLPDTPEPSARRRAEEIEDALDSLEVPEDIRPYFRGASTAPATARGDEHLRDTLRRATADMHANKRRRKSDKPPDDPQSTM
jgi:two-component system cell cycle response regulator